MTASDATSSESASKYETLSREALISIVEEQCREIEKLQNHIVNANRRQFGKKSERLDAEESRQELLFSFEPVVQVPVSETVEVKLHKRTISRGRKPLPADLPRRREEHFPEQKTCEQCGGELVKIGEEITEELDFIPVRYEVIEHAKIKCACPRCHGAKVVIGALPASVQPLERSRPGAGLLTHIIISKYVDHIPLFRQEQIFVRQGIILHRQRMSDWIGGSIELLERLWAALKKEVLELPYVQADETHIKVRDLEALRDKGELFTGYFWAVHAPPNLAFFDYYPTRASEAAKEVLKGFRGVVQTDAYAGYNPVLLPKTVLRLACLAHIRRKFIEARPTAPSDCDTIIKQIAKLYALEELWRALEPEERLLKRQKLAKPEFNKLYGMLASLSQRMLPKHALQEALQYALKQETEMSRYLENGNFQIDNNSIERQIRPIAIGRKNYLFAGSHEGAHRAAVLYSLLATCKLNKVNPQAWLSDVLRRLPDYPVSRVAELLPHHWQPAA